MNLFYTKSLQPVDSPGEFRLEGQEAVHAARVLRIREGETVFATDGAGTIYNGKAVSIGKNSIRVKIDNRETLPKPSPEICIAVGNIRKRDRLEFAIEKAVELGVCELIVFHADHSEKQKLRMDRLKSAALSAVKQSRRAWLPEIIECGSLQEVLDLNRSAKTIVADETKQARTLDKEVAGKEEKLVFIVGPEGGLSKSEKEIVASLDTVSLGRYRLRTETAVVTLSALFSETGFFSTIKKPDTPGTGF